MRDNNTIHIVGTVTDELMLDHEIYGEKFYRTTVGCYRKSGYRDNVPIIISEKLLNCFPFTSGIAVDVEGQIRSHSCMKDGQNIRGVYVFVTELKLSDGKQDLNETKLTGFVCRAAKYRETISGRFIADFILAVNRAYGKSDYIPVIVWGRNAKYARNIKIGQMLEIEGRFQSRVYTKRFEDGTSVDKIAYEISVSKMTTKENENG